MKKILNIVLFLAFSFLLTSCLNPQNDVIQAKKDLGIIETEKQVTDLGDIDQNMNTSSWNIDSKLEEKLPVEDKEEIKTIEIKSLTENNFLELDSLEKENLTDWEVEINWKTLTNVDKIVVKFVNETSDFPVDTYTLKQFSPWDKTFLYRAFSRYETLDFGKNVYIFEAYSWDKVSKLELTLNIIEETEQDLDKKVEKTYEDISLDKLPVWSWFWNPVDLWNWNITYSDLKGLEIKRDIISDFSCENLTSVLADRINSWFFWNTCRPIDKQEWLTFYVISLDWDNYVYEKHYYLSYEGIYWVMEIETWTWVNIDNISDKNQELKEKNEGYNITKISDDLFDKILN